MEIVEINPTDVRVRNGLERFRTDMGDVESLAKSFKEHRQILPIIITRNYELIDGGRRLAAAIYAGIKVKAVFEDVKDDFEMRQLELEANLYRKDFTPAEEQLAIAELHRMNIEKHGEGGSGTKDGWTMEDTAKKIGKSRNTVKSALEMADLIEAFPQLTSCKTKNEIKKAGRAIQKVTAAMEGVAKNEEIIASGKKPYSLHNADALDFLPGIPDNSIDIILSDPLFGFSADIIAQKMGKRYGAEGFNTSGYNISDDEKTAFNVLDTIAKEGFRFTKFDAQGFIFVAPEHFWSVRQLFMSYGWRVYVKPMIWVKRSVGQCNLPGIWPASCYEMFMFIRKDQARLIKEGQPDWVECPPVNATEKTHQFEKPIMLLDNLLDRISLPGQTMIDPCMGSGASIISGLKHKLVCTGIDISKEAYAYACQRIADLEKEKA